MAYQALYRKYRPTNFDEVVGQTHIIQTLKNAIVQNRIAHAYLFCGPRGTGKTSIAKIFAKTLNCTNSQDAPCGVCENCKMAANGSHPDIIEIDAASNNGVDEVRNLIDKVKYAPMQGKYKIYIIDEVHMMTSGAFNALLKTIEEPPAHVIFIFATTEPNKVLPTIISRCQRFDFNKVSMHDIKYRLSVVCKNEGIEIDENGLTLIAQLADGGMRDALSILDQCVAYCSSHIDVNDIRKIYGVVTSEDIGKLFYSVYKKDVDSFVKDIQKYSNMGMDIKRLTADFIHMLKDSLILDYSENSTLVSDMNKDMIRKYFKLAPINFRIKCMEELMDTYNKYTYASNALDYLEASLLKISSYSYESKIHIIDSDYNDFKEIEEEENYETSYDDTSDNSDIIEKNIQKDDNNGVLEKFEISDVSRETLKQSENTNNKIILNDEFVIQLLVGATKMERSIDTNKFNNIGQFISSLEFGKYAATLRNSSIMASGSNYIVVCVSNEIFAKQINEFELNYGYEDFMEVLLGKAKKVFALDKTQQSRVKDEFKERMISGNLPEPYQVRLKRKDKESENNMSIEDHMKSLFPNIEIKED
ncbi:MAG: DNA polymerase III subunit gamma/tau [Holdemanella porci]|uniref:DNA polymerase III subunit gamma/tau n=1 Tax=Holdemanella TaxID=1573535 RepID=UPI00242D130B|nr:MULTISPECIES: DNA polymerase III subunit gamma/tau [Holdemanella]MCI7166253.1 DNA polymerase III subunit gamma/tau [Holdemanella sp.]MDD6452913.1 DNA polymerase III subunit gamma/tau [Holdemanella porci]